MVKRNTLKINILGSLALISLLFGHTIPAAASCNTVNGTTTCTNTTTFNVKVTEVLTVSITEPDTWASGTNDTLLTNKVGFSVISNNPAGFTATMKAAEATVNNTTDTTANLINIADSSAVIETLTSDDVAASSFPANRWGYSIVTTGASPTAYSAMVGSTGTPIEIASTTTASNIVTKDIYFAAKSDGSIASGTYARGVVISVVSGVIDTGENPTNPVTPVNPVTPSDDPTPDNDTPTYIAPTTPPKGNSDTGVTVATTTSEDTTATPNTTTTTTEIMEGNATESYVAPAGVTTINEGTPLATGLAVTAGVAAITGVAFFVVAKRRSDDDEDDEDF